MDGPLPTACVWAAWCCFCNSFLLSLHSYFHAFPDRSAIRESYRGRRPPGVGILHGGLRCEDHRRWKVAGTLLGTFLQAHDELPDTSMGYPKRTTLLRFRSCRMLVNRSIVFDCIEFTNPFLPSCLWCRSKNTTRQGHAQNMNKVREAI